MNGLTHMLIGILFGMLYFDYIGVGGGFTIKALFAAFLIFGALLPDADQPNSYVSRKIPIISWFTKHRGVMHSIWIPLLLFVTAIIYPRYEIYLMAIIIGYLTHLAADSITLQGIRPFQPFNIFHLRGPIQTGGITETILAALIVIFMVVK